VAADGNSSIAVYQFIDSKGRTVSFIQIPMRYEANPKCTKSHIFVEICTTRTQPPQRTAAPLCPSQSRAEAQPIGPRQCVKNGSKCYAMLHKIGFRQNVAIKERCAKLHRKEQSPQPGIHSLANSWQMTRLSSGVP
jgi:hypothetical protein